ncbi:hypothetical protein [Sodalis glossinidius]|uniref:hypothetical protein n=1 Tax=Sodalis glossinidius TaxID=63612 RepID=UPI0011D064A9|nr:hypothetical protein [Sodalis glossinidius]
MNINLSGSLSSVSSLQSPSRNERNTSCVGGNITNISNKSVRFNDGIISYTVEKGFRSKEKLSVYETEYRRAVDKQAKEYGLRCAFGHDEPHKDPYPYDHRVGLNNMIEYSNNR